MEYWNKILKKAGAPVCLYLLIVSLQPATASAGVKSTKKFTFSGNGILSLTIPSTWRRDRAGADHEGLGPGRAVIYPSEGDDSRILIELRDNPSESEDSNRPETIKKLTEALAARGTGGDIKIKGLRGPVCWGYYFSRDKWSLTSWRNYLLTRGFLGVGDAIFEFRIRTPSEDSSMKRAAVNALRTAVWERTEQSSGVYKGLSGGSRYPSSRRRPRSSSGFSREEYEYSRTVSCERWNERADDHNKEVEDLVDEYSTGRIDCEDFAEEYSDIQDDYEDLYD